MEQLHGLVERASTYLHEEVYAVAGRIVIDADPVMVLHDDLLGQAEN